MQTIGLWYINHSFVAYFYVNYFLMSIFLCYFADEYTKHEENHRNHIGSFVVDDVGFLHRQERYA